MSDKNKINKGEVYAINDKNIRGHRSLIIDIDKLNVDTIVFTHSPRTRNKNNHLLQENPDKKDLDEKGKLRDAYVLKAPQKAKKKDIGKNYPNYKIKNSIDKSYIRHISKKK